MPKNTTYQEQNIYLPKNNTSPWSKELLRTCKVLAHKMTTKAFASDELYSFCIEHLPNIVNNYDDTKNTKLSTYAYSILQYKIRNYITNYNKISLTPLTDQIHKKTPKLVGAVGVLNDLLKCPTLTKNEKYVLNARLGTECIALKDIASVLMLSIGRISHIERSAILKITKYRKEKYDRTI